MEVLIVGSGGREHALAWKLKQSPKVSKIYIASGNAGTALVGENVPIKSCVEILSWLETHPVGLVVIGPDNYLAEGLTDLIQKLGIPVFGPTKAAAEIEWSKSYAKQFMLEEGIPTARHRVFETAEVALKYIRKQQFPLVIKADGLAAGKGVVVAENLAEAEDAVDEIMNQKAHGDAGGRLIIEEFLEGFEISVHAFCDGENAILFPSSKDHKRVFDGDQGPNTGGMGTVAPVPLLSEKQMQLIQERIVLPTLRGLARRGRSFRGVLFPGIMLTKYGPSVIEFNARFGDPETQSYMRLLESDLLDILLACTNGTLNDIKIRWADFSACCVVVASRGYPAVVEKGILVTLPPNSAELVIFHAGTTVERESIETSGGRVLGITATGTTLEEALRFAYEAVSSNLFNGAQFRTDIGKTSLPEGPE